MQFIGGFLLGVLGSAIAFYFIWQNNKKLFGEVSGILDEAIVKATAEVKEQLEKIKALIKDKL